MEFDHLFICVDHGAHEAEVLKKFGLTEGAANQHRGQGTANRRFFFHNGFIELLYLQDAAETQSELTKPTHLYERLTSGRNEASPFGICFRPSAETQDQAPFPSWIYKPIYLPAHLHIEIGDAPLTEPMWFFASFAARPDSTPIQQRQPLEHPRGLLEITALQVDIPNIQSYSEPARCATEVKGVALSRGNGHVLEIGFDHESAGESHDFRPLLPLIMRW